MTASLIFGSILFAVVLLLFRGLGCQVPTWLIVAALLPANVAVAIGAVVARFMPIPFQ